MGKPKGPADRPAVVEVNCGDRSFAHSLSNYGTDHAYEAEGTVLWLKDDTGIEHRYVITAEMRWTVK